MSFFTFFQRKKTFKSKDYIIQLYSRLFNNVCFVLINDREYPVYFNKTKTKAYVLRTSKKTGMEYRQYFVPDMLKTIQTFHDKFPKVSFLLTKNQ